VKGEEWEKTSQQMKQSITPTCPSIVEKGSKQNIMYGHLLDISRQGFLSSHFV
jgi:hypothetical protein